jgi:hypothetical protein
MVSNFGCSPAWLERSQCSTLASKSRMGNIDKSIDISSCPYGVALMKAIGDDHEIRGKFAHLPLSNFVSQAWMQCAPSCSKSLR